MRVDANFFCTVPMPDAGDPSVAPTARRYGNDAVIECYENLLALGADRRRSSASTRCGSPSTTSSTRATRCCPTSSMFGQHLGRRRPSSCASGRCSTSCRSGTRCAWPRTSPSPTSSPAGGWSSASAAAPCPARRGRSAPSSPVGRQRDVGRARPHQPRDLRGVDGGHQAGLVQGALLLPRQALRVPARRRARPRHARQRPHADPQAAAPRRHLPAGHVAGDDRVRAQGRPQGRLLAAERRQPEAEVGPLRGDPRGDAAPPVGPGEDRCLVLNLHVGRDPRGRRCVKGRPGHDEFNKFLVAVRPVLQLPQSRTASKVAVRLHCPTRRGVATSRRSRSSARSTTPSTPSASGATCSTSSTSASSSTTRA